MPTDLESLLQNGTILTQRQRRFLELLEDGLRIVDAELLSGLPSGAVASAAQKARDAAAEGRKPDSFGGTLLLIEARGRAREKNVEENLLDEGGAAAVAVLKERKRDRRLGIADPHLSTSSSACGKECAENREFRKALLEGFRRIQERAESISQERLRRGAGRGSELERAD